MPCHAMPYNKKERHEMQSNEIQYHVISNNAIKYNTILSNKTQYNDIPSITMQYNYNCLTISSIFGPPVTISSTQTSQSSAVGTKSGPSGPIKTTGAPKQALLEAQECCRGPLRSQNKANLCGYHEFDQTMAVWTEYGTQGPSEDLRGP